MKFLWKRLLPILLFCYFNTVHAQPAPPRTDNQFWHETQLIKPVSRDKDLVIIGVLRQRRDFVRPVDERLGAGLAFKLSKYLTIMPT